MGASPLGLRRAVAGALGAASLLLPGLAAGQSYLVHTYTVSDGLPNGEVYAVAQDGVGRMWFATRAGLASYDGLTWQRTGPPGWSTEVSLGALRSDGRGSVWVLARGPGVLLAAFDGRQWHQPLDDPATIPEHVVVTTFDVATGRDGDTVAAVGTYRHGLLVWEAGHWHRITERDGLTGGPVRSVAAWDGRFIVATPAAAYTVGKGGVERDWTTLLPPAAGEIAAVAVGAPRAAGPEPMPDLWVATAQSLLHLEDGDLRVRGEGVGTPFVGRRAPFLPVLLADTPHALYLGTRFSLRRLDLRTGAWQALGTAQGLLSEGASDMLVDREGNTWVASLRGLSKIVSRRFATFRQRHGLLEDEVTAICEPRPGVVVLGHGSGLTVLDGDVPRRLGFPPLEGSGTRRVLDLRPDERGGVWIAAAALGLGRLDPSGRLRWYADGPGAGHLLHSVVVDAEGTVWTAGNGLFRLDGERLVAVPVLPDGAGAVRRMAVLHDGTLALAMSSAGLLLLRDGMAERPVGPASPDAASAYTVLEDRQERVWVGTRAGLLRLEGDRLAKPAGEAGTIAPVFLIVEDGGGALWLGTDDGVVRWDGGAVRRYRIKDGLAGRETNRAAGLLDGQGRVWIGTESGVSVYRPEDDLPARAGPLVELLSARCGDRTWAPDEEATLTESRTPLELEFRAVSFIDEHAVRYRYRIEGLDSGWSRPLTASERVARVAHLPSGAYRFHVQAATATGRWSPPVCSARIRILPPVWRRWWALGMAVLVAAGVIALAARWGLHRRTRHRLQRQAALERRDAILEAVTNGGKELLREGSFETGVQHLLDHLSAAADVCRVYVFENHTGEDGELLSSRRFERAAPGVTAQIDNPQLRSLPLEASGLARWVSVLGGGDVIAGKVWDLPAAERAVLAAQRISSILVVPIMVGGRWWGFIGFDACRGEREWSNLEIGAMRLAADTVAAAVTRREADRALKESEERFRQVVERALVGIYRSSPEGRVIMANPMLISMFGFSSFEELAACDLDDWARRSGYPRTRFKELMERDGVVTGLEGSWVRPDGTTVHVRESARAVRDTSGAIASYEGVMEDLTAQKELEQQLRAAQRMETVGRLAGGVAHELNNLLQGIGGNVQLLEMGVDRETTKELVAEVTHLVRRGAAFTRQLLLFTKRAVTVPQRVDLNEVVRDAEPLLRRLGSESIHFEVELGDGGLVVDADPAQLEQIAANLVTNSVEAMPRGGVLTIRTGRERGRPWFEVEDTGSGIPEEQREAVFEPFFSTKDRALHGGLGLSVVHGIVHQHGGAVELRSEVGRGSALRIVLPPHESGAFKAVRADPAPADNVPPASQRVLVVDDEDGVRAGLVKVLTVLGHRPVDAASGEEAAGLALEPPPDLLLTDVSLPGMSGVELAKTLRARWPGLKVIVMSGHSEGEAMGDLASCDDARFLGKPFDMDALARTLRAALGLDPGGALDP